MFGVHYSKADPERVSCYHHAALNPRFRRIDGKWFCQLGVDYCFTREGRNESSFADSLLAGIKRLERHPAVVGWTRMWEAYLQGDLPTADSLLTFGCLLTFQVDRGIDDAWWGPAPATSADDAPEGHPDADVDATLNQAGIDQDDLLSLLTEAPGPATSPGRPPALTRRRASRKSPLAASHTKRSNA